MVGTNDGCSHWVFGDYPDATATDNCRATQPGWGTFTDALPRQHAVRRGVRFGDNEGDVDGDVTITATRRRAW
ncbi:MAG: hypothetical protein KIS77_00410 [Saprospiraceae bacterium]|nr:hypothetical protein [Saprospiraceae bacterium]